MSNNIIYKIADREEEFEKIHNLNYRTFVEEIPQHGSNPNKKLVDKFHLKNQYAIAIQQGELIGMLAFNDKRPFSLDEKMNGLDQYLPYEGVMLEIRLLSVKDTKRGGVILFRLLSTLYQWILTQQKTYHFIVISGTTRQVSLYKKMGFEPFHTLVGKPEAWYQPMYLEIENFLAKHEKKL